MTAESDVHLLPMDRSHLARATALLADACRFERAAEVAEELLFGPGYGRVANATLATTNDRNRTLAGVSVVSGAWLRLLAVHPDCRGTGVGTALLRAAEARIAASRHGCVRVMDEPGNYLAPGVDIRDRDTCEWLERRGYRQRGENVDLLVDVRNNSRVSEQRASALAGALPDYEFRRARDSDRAHLVHMIAATFSAAWAFEVERALDGQPSGVHLALYGGQLAAFAAHDGNNRGLGWFGPAGTLPDHRQRGLGHALLCACLVDVARAGHEVCEISWIGPRGFYERAVGVIGERRFAVYRKDLS